LAANLARQGRHEESLEVARIAREIDPNEILALQVLGRELMLQGKLADAENELRAAIRINEQNPRSWLGLAELFRLKGNWSETIVCLEQALKHDPVNTVIYANLAIAYNVSGQYEKARNCLKEAERFRRGDIGGEQILCLAYCDLGESQLALEHFRHFAELARKLGVDPAFVRYLETRAFALKSKIAPVSVVASMPKEFSAESLTDVVERTLSNDEREMVVDPLAIDPRIEEWAKRLTDGSPDQVESAKRIFSALADRPQDATVYGARTAIEVFEAWKRDNEFFSCQEYSRLFIAMARSIGLKSFYVDVEKDWRGEWIHHACAAVFLETGPYLVDISYQWFGVPHKEFRILNDVQALAHYFFQPVNAETSLRRCKLAAKLFPDYVWGQLSLAAACMKSQRWEEAMQVLDLAERTQPERWDTYYLRAGLALHYEDVEQGIALLRRSVELNSRDPESHRLLGTVLRSKGKLRESLTHFREVLRNSPSLELMEEVQRLIVQTNEELRGQEGKGKDNE
jgi:tetratricopeptide (TPR) repeat protein